MNSFPMTISYGYRERQNRAITFFKLILAIPWMIWAYLWGVVVMLVVILSWFILLFTGKWPQEFFKFCLSYMRFYTGLNAWMLSLTDRWPAWGGTPKEDSGLNLDITLLDQYSRAKVLFRIVLVIPLYLLQQGVGGFILCFWFLAFWAEVFTGRLPKWCYEHLAAAFVWTVRVQAFIYLMIESFPPFKGQDEGAAQPSLGGATTTV